MKVMEVIFVSALLRSSYFCSYSLFCISQFGFVYVCLFYFVRSLARSFCTSVTSGNQIRNFVPMAVLIN